MTQSNYKPVTRTAFGIILNRQGQVLVGNDSTGRIAVPGGKFDPEDACNVHIALRREIQQEVGKKFAYRYIQSRPKIFCTGRDTHTLVDALHPEVPFDLRFFFLMEAVNQTVVETEPDEFSKPRFVDLAELDGKIAGIDMRYAVSHALGLYVKDGSLNAAIPKRSEHFPIDYPYIRETLKGMGFSDKFAKTHSRLHKAARKERQNMSVPNMSVTSSYVAEYA